MLHIFAKKHSPVFYDYLCIINSSGSGFIFKVIHNRGTTTNWLQAKGALTVNTLVTQRILLLPLFQFISM